MSFFPIFPPALIDFVAAVQIVRKPVLAEAPEDDEEAALINRGRKSAGMQLRPRTIEEMLVDHTLLVSIAMLIGGWLFLIASIFSTVGDSTASVWVFR